MKFHIIVTEKYLIIEMRKIFLRFHQRYRNPNQKIEDFQKEKGHHNNIGRQIYSYFVSIS